MTTLSPLTIAKKIETALDLMGLHANDTDKLAYKVAEYRYHELKSLSYNGSPLNPVTLIRNRSLNPSLNP